MKQSISSIHITATRVEFRRNRFLNAPRVTMSLYLDHEGVEDDDAFNGTINFDAKEVEVMRRYCEAWECHSEHDFTVSVPGSFGPSIHLTMVDGASFSGEGYVLTEEDVQEDEPMSVTVPHPATI